MPWLTQRLDEKSGSREHQEIRLEWPVHRNEVDAKAVALDDVFTPARREVRAVDDEARVWLLALESPGKVDRMRHREAKPSAGLEDAGGLLHSRLRLVHVLEGHERHDEVERPVLERERGRVGHGGFDHLARGCDHPWGGVDADDPVTAPRELRGHTPLAASEIERSPPRPGDELDERRDVEL